MESTSSSNTTTSRDADPSDDSLKSELLEKELQALERFQKLLIAIHTQYTNVFEDIMAATNGEIAQYLRVLPSVVKEQTKDLLTMNFRKQGYTIFSGFEHTRRLITKGIETIRSGLEDFYLVGDAILVEKAKGADWADDIDAKPLDMFLASKEAKRVELENIEKEIAAFEADVVLLNVELDMGMTSYWNNKENENDGPKEDYPAGDLHSQYLEAIAEKRKFMIRVLRSDFDFAFSSLEKILEPTMRFNFNPRVATLFQQHPTRVPYELQERVNKIPDGLASSKPALVINELSDAVTFVQSEYAKAQWIIVDYYESGIKNGDTNGQPLARMQKTVQKTILVKHLHEWDFMQFAIQLAYARGEIERYCQEIERIANGVAAKTQSDMEKEAEKATEELLLFMMEVQRAKEDLMGPHAAKQEKEGNWVRCGSGTKNRNEHLRKVVKEMVDCAEPWKQVEEMQSKMNDAFIKWQHLHPASGGTDGFLRALGFGDWEKELPTKEKLAEIVQKLRVNM